MTDIVDRLRRRHGLTHDPDQLWGVISTLNKDADEAADEIERLRAALLALSQPDGFVRATIKEDRQARIDYARAALEKDNP